VINSTTTNIDFLRVNSNATTTGSMTIGSLLNCDTIDTDANGLLKCGTDNAGAGGTGSNWIWGADQTFIKPSTTVGIILQASTTITSLVVPDSLTGTGFTNAWNLLANATTTYPGFQTQFNTALNATTTWGGFSAEWAKYTGASSTIITVADLNATTTHPGFITQFNTAYNATTTQAGFQTQFNTALNATTTWAGFQAEFNNKVNASSTIFSSVENTDYWANNFATNWATQYNATTTLNGFTNNSANWDTAYGWGDWSDEGFLTSVAFTDLTGSPSDVITAGTGIDWDGDTLNVSVTGGGAFSWTATDYGMATSTIIGFQGGFLSNASSTITSLVVADSLTGAGFTNAFNSALNATTTYLNYQSLSNKPTLWATADEQSFWNGTSTWAGFQGEFNNKLNASSTIVTVADLNATTTHPGFITQFNTTYNATTTQAGFQGQFNTALNATTTWAGFTNAWNSMLNATSTVMTNGDLATSNQLLTLLSDETGTGVATFATLPTFTTGINILGYSSSTSIVINNLFTVNASGNATSSAMVVGADGASQKGCLGMMSSTGVWTFMYFNGTTQVISDVDCSGVSTSTILIGQ
jgi:hypothetical protein